MKSFLKLTLILVIIMLNACRTSQFPVCTVLSSTKPSRIAGVSSTLLAVCEQHHISITFSTSTIVELRGSLRQMRWLQNNYHILMCDFDQTKISKDESTYIRCFSDSKEWIRIVQSGKNDLLMKSPSIFCSVCCELN